MTRKIINNETHQNLPGHCHFIIRIRWSNLKAYHQIRMRCSKVQVHSWKKYNFLFMRSDIIVTFIMKEFCESMNLFIRKGQNFYQRMQRKSFPTPPISVLPIAVPLKTKRIYSTLAKSPKIVPILFFFPMSIELKKLTIKS